MEKKIIVVHFKHKLVNDN